MDTRVVIRPYRPADAEAFAGVVRAFASVTGTAVPDDAACARLVAAASSEPPPFEVRLAEVDGQVVGYAAFWKTYSTFEGRPSLYIEDLYVVDDARGRGVGVALFDAVIDAARERGCCRIDWMSPRALRGATAFFRARGARVRDAWLAFRMDGDAMLDGE